MVQSARCAFWFGTEERMRWLDTPLSGASITNEGSLYGGQLMNGGGYSFTSKGTHRTYTYRWRDSSPRWLVNQLLGYRNGLYGHGLIYFHDPLSYKANVLPGALSAPGQLVDGAASAVFPGWTSKASTQSPGNLDLPVTTLRLSRSNSSPVGIRTVFVPIPEGYQLHLGAFYQGSGVKPQYIVMDNSGNVSTSWQDVPKLDPAGHNLVSDTSIAGRGIYIAIRPTAASGWIDLQALVGRLFKATRQLTPTDIGGVFELGMGHSGVRFMSDPQVVEHSGINNGQFGISAEFREVGLWEPSGVKGVM